VAAAKVQPVALQNGLGLEILRQQINASIKALEPQILASPDTPQYVVQQGSPRHLQFVTGRNYQLAKYGYFYDFEDYLYDDRINDITPSSYPILYVLDRGFPTDHIELQPNLLKPFQPPTPYQGDNPSGSFLGLKHGTCVASLVASPWLGAAKKVGLVIAPYGNGFQSDTLAAIEKISSDWNLRASDVAILSMSSATPVGRIGNF
jgi:hypothetical protein